MLLHVTTYGRQGILTLLGTWSHLLCPGVRVSLVFTVDYSTYLTGHRFWLRVFLFTWLGVLILTAACSVYLTWTHWFWLLNFAIEMGHKAGATGRQGMLNPPRHLIPPPVFPGVRVSPFVYLICNSYLNLEINCSSVSWPFHRKGKLTIIIAKSKSSRLLYSEVVSLPFESILK
jgi:hypothetical protein